MKYIFKYSLIGLSLLAFSFSANAQMQYNVGEKAVTGKMVEGPNSDGSYTITLESWAVGDSEFSEKTTDLVLVLDVSGSMTEPVGTTTTHNRVSLSYEDVVNGDVEYFIRLDGYWEKIYGEKTNNRYYLYCRPSDIRYLTSSGTTSSRNSAASSTSETGNIVTNYTGNGYGVQSGTSKIGALQSSVETFLDIVNKSDKYTDNTYSRLRSTRLGNRVAIITFSSEYATAAGWTLLGDDEKHVNNNDGYTSLLAAAKTALSAPQGGTNAHLGMNAAKTLMSSSTAGNKTVVMFTDGIPGQNGRWNQNGFNSANNTISYANDIKGTSGNNATIWTVGVFDLTGDDLSNTNTYMGRVSSNYYNVTSMTGTATAASEQKYYKKVDDAAALNAIFADIASESTKHDDIGSTSQMRDVISSSFTLPKVSSGSGTSSATLASLKLTIKVLKLNSNNSGWTEESTLFLNGVDQQEEDADPKVVPTITTSEDGKHEALFVEGFDYTADDSTIGAADGNWVGPRKVQGVTTYGGRKLQISFRIVQAGDVTGGVGTNTNTTESGLYVYKDGKYESVNDYVVPHTTLPINLKITKHGLKHGESATFEVERCRPKNWVESRPLAENIAAMEYNTLQKPVPDGNWKNWSKVIITNKGEDGDPVSKMLVSLDPYYIYKIEEDTWSWAYEAISTEGHNNENTSTVEINPFVFYNSQLEVSPVTGEPLPKHAEAVSINHFNYTLPSGKQTENYKSSKGFTTSTGGSN